MSIYCKMYNRFNDDPGEPKKVTARIEVCLSIDLRTENRGQPFGLGISGCQVVTRFYTSECRGYATAWVDFTAWNTGESLLFDQGEFCKLRSTASVDDPGIPLKLDIFDVEGRDERPHKFDMLTAKYALGDLKCDGDKRQGDLEIVCAQIEIDMSGTEYVSMTISYTADITSCGKTGSSTIAAKNNPLPGNLDVPFELILVNNSTASN